jgi:hypothetical protein
MTKQLKILVAGAMVMLASHGARAQEREAPVRVLAPPSTPCAPRGAICFAPADTNTVALASPAVAAAAAHVASVPLLARKGGGPDASWRIRIEALLRRPSWSGNALFLLYDATDPDARASHTVTAMYQAPLRAARALAAELSLSPIEGVHAGMYHLRVVQLVDAREVVLAEGEVTLR